MIWNRVYRLVAGSGLALAMLLGLGCTTVPPTTGVRFLSVPSFEPGHTFTGSFFATATLPKNTPTVVGVVALPNFTQLGDPAVTLECAMVAPPGVRVPGKLTIAWRITNADGDLLEEDEARLKVRSDGNCKSRRQVLALSDFPPGSVAELAVTVRKRPLAQGTHVAYSVGVG